MAMKSFHERKTQLLNNLDASLDKMPSTPRPVSMSELANTPTRQGGKKSRHCMSDHEEAVKRQRLSCDARHSFANSTAAGTNVMSPRVQASS